MNWRKLLRLAMIFSAMLLAGLAISSWIVAGKLVSSANRPVTVPAGELPLESLTLDSDLGGEIAAWYRPAINSAASVVLLHPLRGNRRSMLGRAKLFHDAGVDVLMIDFQAHGESPGKTITMGFREKHDVRAAVEYVQQRNPNHKIGVVGWSLGGASALLAGPLPIDALVLESVYPTINDAVYDRVDMQASWLKHILAPALLLQMQPRFGISPGELRPIDFVGSVGCPLLIVSGTNDLHVPIEKTRLMFSAASDPKVLVELEGAGHEDLQRFDPQRYKTEVVAFLTRHLKTD